MNDLVVSNTTFEQHPRRVYTWKSPGDRHRNQIDYIMIGKRWRTTIKSVKTRPGADCGSDHQLLVAKLKIKLRSKNKKNPLIRYDVERISEKYKVEVKNKFSALLTMTEEGQRPDSLWEEAKKAIHEAAKDNIGRGKKTKQPWIRQRTLEVADKRRKAKEDGDTELWQQLNKDFTKCAREDKNLFLERKCEELEMNMNQPRKAFSILREITKKWAPISEVINDSNGKTLTESEDIKDRWAEYCHKLYEERGASVTPQGTSFTYEKEPPPLKAEVEWALSSICNRKSPGIDNIQIELWKAAGEEGVDVLWNLCNLIWNTEEWPKDWCRAIFIPLPKKGNLKECSNHRTISLIVHASKVLLKIIAERVQMKYGVEMAEEQAGFVKGKGTREQIVNIRNIMEKCRSHNIPLYMCFIDYTKAFDCVRHTQLWDIMTKMGFPLHIIHLVQNLYKDQEATVRTSDGYTKWFKIGRGVRQGCILSPKLYNIYAESIMRESVEEAEGGVDIGGERTNNLRFADDTTLICTSKQDLMEMLKEVKDKSSEKGLLLNSQKTKVMVIDPERRNREEFILDGELIEQVDEFVYLGSLLSNKGTCVQEIKRRLAMGRSATQKMVKIWKSRGVSTKLKVRLLRAMVFPIATYGSESWAMNAREKKRVDAFEMWCYRRILRISWRDRRSNEWVIEKIGSGMQLRKGICERKMRLFGHIIRRDGLEKRLAQGKVPHPRRRGRPTTSWYQDIKDWTGMGMAAASHLAEDREGWRHLIRITATQLSVI